MKKPQEHIKKKINIYVLDFNTFQETKISMLVQTPYQQTKMYTNGSSQRVNPLLN